MARLVTLVSEVLADEDDLLEREIFGTGDPHVIARQIEKFLEEHFGALPEPIFFRHSVGIVVGARLDEQEVVMKVHYWRASLQRLEATQRVQLELSLMDLPVPRPLFGPLEFGAGVATVEELIHGDIVDGHDIEVRKVLARELCRLIAAGRKITNIDGLGLPALLADPSAPLWPTPHSPRFDFEATSQGAEWIDDLAWSARRRLAALSGELVIGHLDWRVGNLGFVGTGLTAIYDWDSIGLATEAFIVGSAAATFSSDWSKPGGSLPSLDEMRAFVADYQNVREKSFDAEEIEAIDAANLILITYGARCQHSDFSLSHDSSTGLAESWITLLRERGELGLIAY
ncbi:MAG TPA: phosphotransferase [Acidimicrobiales bacterium]|nr:phosphotransferase [Acidimicrobiales bacterium]